MNAVLGVTTGTSSTTSSVEEVLLRYDVEQKKDRSGSEVGGKWGSGVLKKWTDYPV